MANYIDGIIIFVGIGLITAVLQLKDFQLRI